jgi:hypothetical protein
VQVPYGQGYRLELVVSCKVANRKVRTEESRTTNSGTDEQESYMKLLAWISKHIIVKSKTRKVITEMVATAGIRRKKTLLPGEVSITTGWYSSEVSRSHSTHEKRVA